MFGRVHLHLMAIICMSTLVNLNLFMSHIQIMLGIESLSVYMKRLSWLNSMQLTPIFGLGLSRSGLMAAICRLPLNISSEKN